MKTETKDTRTIIRYLLGEMSDEERIQIEKLYFEDTSYYELILDLEDELIHHYVHGKLADKDRQRLERFFLTTPERSEKVKLARAIIEHNVITRDHEKYSTTQILKVLVKKIGVLLPRRPALQWLFSSIFVVLFLYSVWLYFKNKELENQMIRSATTSQLFEDSLRELNQSRMQTLLSSQKQEFDIISGHPRGIEEKKFLKISKYSVLINLRLFLTEHDTTLSHYRVELRGENHRADPIVIQSNLQVTPEGSIYFVLFQVPVSVFKRNDELYSINLIGVTATGMRKVIGDYYFQVEKQIK